MKEDLIKGDPVLSEIVGRLVRKFSPHKIFHFGSRATGSSHEDSDGYAELGGKFAEFCGAGLRSIQKPANLWG
jgi:hypothetical protein